MATASSYRDDQARVIVQSSFPHIRSCHKDLYPARILLQILNNDVIVRTYYRKSLIATYNGKFSLRLRCFEYKNTRVQEGAIASSHSVAVSVATCIVNLRNFDEIIS